MQDIVISTEDIWKGGFFRVKRQRIRSANGRNFFRELVSRSDGVAVVPITSDGKVLMIQEYTAGAEKQLLFIPGGMTDATVESKRQQEAQRELREETGMRANKLIKLWQVFEAPAVMDRRVHVYLGLDLVLDPLQSSVGDTEITVSEMGLDEAIAKVSAPDGSASAVLGALFLAKNYLVNHQGVDSRG